jgi:hypothetical protein
MALHKLRLGGAVGSKESGQLLLTAKATERNRFCNGQPQRRLCSVSAPAKRITPPTEFLDRHPPLRRYNVIATLEI